MRTLINRINQEVVIKVLLLALVFSVCAYLYFVNATTFSAAAYENMNDDILELQSEISELELAYIEVNRNINEHMSSEYGLVAMSENDMIYAKRDTRLTYIDERE